MPDAPKQKMSPLTLVEEAGVARLTISRQSATAREFKELISPAIVAE